MTARSVWIDGARVALAPAALLGQGGEAEVYDLGDGRVLKWWKPPDHPDYDGQPAAQAAAARRLAEAPARLRALPGNLPAAVVAPCGLALAGKRSRDLAGYLMPRISGEPLASYGEPRWRRAHPVDGAELVAVLLALHDALAGLHRAGVVVGDCNDLNVLVDGRRVHLIDVDSYQLPGFPCHMFSERFVDPRLCDRELTPARPHDPDSDWFAFAAMAFRSLLGVGPWGGVHRPPDPARACPITQRALRRISALDGEIVYPRAARLPASLPDELLETFRAIFERDRRGPFPRDELARLRLRRCPGCGEDHARARCPICQALALAPPVQVHGRLRWWPIVEAELAASSYEVTATTPVWLEAGALWRRARTGLASRPVSGQPALPERIGNVLAGQTRAWCGPRLGAGFYRAGGYAVGFVFRPERGVLDDRVALPRLRGRVLDAGAIIGDDRAWLWLVSDDAGRLATTLLAVGADARVLATATLADAPWLAGLPGACAAGPHLFVPSDDGIARVEILHGAIAHTRTFAETAALVGAGDRLVLAGDPPALSVIRRRDAIRLELA